MIWAVIRDKTRSSFRVQAPTATPSGGRLESFQGKACWLPSARGEKAFVHFTNPEGQMRE